jgi:D-Tyr-tRNAtyr deacylase
MLLVIQRVQQAQVLIDQKVHSQIGRGLLVLLGIPSTRLISCHSLVSKKTHSFTYFFR